VHYARIEIQVGAVVDGQLVHDQAAAEKENVVTLKPATGD
jgi:hypothetical protein